MKARATASMAAAWYSAYSTNLTSRLPPDTTPPAVPAADVKAAEASVARDAISVGALPFWTARSTVSACACAMHAIENACTVCAQVHVLSDVLCTCAIPSVAWAGRWARPYPQCKTYFRVMHVVRACYLAVRDSTLSGLQENLSINFRSRWASTITARVPLGLTWQLQSSVSTALMRKVAQWSRTKSKMPAAALSSL